MQNRKIIVVLGMHRSGTSLVTQALSVLGVNLGNRLMQAAADNNARGFFEDVDLHNLNVEMLQAQDSDWHRLAQPRTHAGDGRQTRDYLPRAKAILAAKIATAPVFAFKDPRVARLLPFWQQCFAELALPACYVLTLRHPLSVVDSLRKRDGFDVEKSYLLWLGYVLDSLLGTAGQLRLLVDYDKLMQAPDAELTRMATALDLPVDPARLAAFQTGFLDHGLRHSLYGMQDLLADPGCPPAVAEAYAALAEVAAGRLSLDDPDLTAQLQRWQDERLRMDPALRLADKAYGEQEAVRQLEAVYASNSWRLTEPLRKLAEFIRNRRA